jgi:hypothetical protein
MRLTNIGKKITFNKNVCSLQKNLMTCEFLQWTKYGVLMNFCELWQWPKFGALLIFCKNQSW